MYQRILFATDGSAASDRAMQEVVKLAGPGSEVRVLTVLENPLEAFPATFGVIKDEEGLMLGLREEGEAVLQRVQEQLGSLGVTAETSLVELPLANHDIPSAIEAEAERWQPDVIVLGTHGRRGLRRLLIGSVAEHVVRISRFPVLLVRGR